MNTRLVEYQKAINNLPETAKTIILSIVLGFIFIIWYYGLWQPLQNSIAQAKITTKTLEKSIRLLKDQLQEVKTISNNKAGPETQTSQTETIKVLQDLLATRYNLALVQLETETTIPQNSTNHIENKIIIKFQSDYFSTMAYLQAIEKSIYGVRWDKLEYDVIKYPIANITIQIHTIN